MSGIYKYKPFREEAPEPSSNRPTCEEIRARVEAVLEELGWTQYQKWDNHLGFLQQWQREDRATELGLSILSEPCDRVSLCVYRKDRESSALRRRVFSTLRMLPLRKVSHKLWWATTPLSECYDYSPSDILESLKINGIEVVDLFEGVVHDLGPIDSGQPLPDYKPIKFNNKLLRRIFSAKMD